MSDQKEGSVSKVSKFRQVSKALLIEFNQKGLYFFKILYSINIEGCEFYACHGIRFTLSSVTALYGDERKLF